MTCLIYWGLGARCHTCSRTSTASCTWCACICPIVSGHPVQAGCAAGRCTSYTAVDTTCPAIAQRCNSSVQTPFCIGHCHAVDVSLRVYQPRRPSLQPRVLCETETQYFFSSWDMNLLFCSVYMLWCEIRYSSTGLCQQITGCMAVENG